MVVGRVESDVASIVRGSRESATVYDRGEPTPYSVSEDDTLMGSSGNIKTETLPMQQKLVEGIL